MELNKLELLALEDATKAPDCRIWDLDELELAMIGGGIGETVLA